MTSSISPLRRSTVVAVITTLIFTSSASGSASAFSFPDFVFPENAPLRAARPDVKVPGSAPQTGKFTRESDHPAAFRAYRAEDGKSGGSSRRATSVEREAKR